MREAPAFRFHLAVGDSLLHGPGQQTLHGDADLAGFAYSTEDLEVLQSVLAGGLYDAVVGNPPYITVKDPAFSGLAALASESERFVYHGHAWTPQK